MKKRGPLFGAVLFVTLAVVATLLSGCTMKLTGETSVMKQWDRPNEVWTIKNEDVRTQETGTLAPAPAPTSKKTLEDLKKALQDLEDTIKKTRPQTPPPAPVPVPEPPKVNPSDYMIPPVIEPDKGYYLYRHLQHEDHGERACFERTARVLYTVNYAP